MITTRPSSDEKRTKGENNSGFVATHAHFCRRSGVLAVLFSQVSVIPTSAAREYRFPGEKCLPPPSRTYRTVRRRPCSPASRARFVPNRYSRLAAGFVRMPDLSARETSSGQPVPSAMVNAHHRQLQTNSPSSDGGLKKLSVEQCSTSRPSSNELAKAVKRPLLIKSEENDEIKKSKPNKNNYKEEQLRDIILGSTNRSEEDIVNMSKKNHQTVHSVKTNDGNISQVPNNTSSKKCSKDTNNDVINGPVSEEIYGQGEPSSVMNKCVPVLSKCLQNSDTKINHKNDIVENGTITENSNQNSDINISCPSKPSSSKHSVSMLPKIPIEIHSVFNNTQNSVEPQSTVDNTEIITTDTGDANGGTMDVSDHNENVEVLDSDSEGDPRNDDKLDEELFNEILGGVVKLTESKFTNLLRLFNKKNIPFRQFESFVLQKCVEFLTNGSEQGKQRGAADAFLQREREWQIKINKLKAEHNELKAVVTMHIDDLKKNPKAKPHIVTRTVGLQAVLCSRREIGFHRSRTLLPALQNSNIDPVNVISDDDDDVLEVQPPPMTGSDLQNTNSTTTENATPEMVTSVPSPPRASNSNEVPSALPLSVDACIDLTDDVADVPTTSRNLLVRPPVRIAPRQNAISSVSHVSSSSILTNNSSTQAMLTNNVTYITNMATSTSGVFMRTSAAPSSEQAISSNLSKTSTRMMVSANTRPPPGFIPINANVVKDGPRYALVTTPVINRQMHPVNVTFARQISGTQFATLPPVPAGIPIHQHPAPLPNMPNPINNPEWKKLPPAPMLAAKITGSPNSKALLLSWDLNADKRFFADVSRYEIFGYHETSSPPKSDLWQRIGEVSALPLPMACTLTQFSVGLKYHFAVRALDIYSRVGPFSTPQSIFLSG